MVIAHLQWEYQGYHPTFELVGPVGSYRISFLLDLPQESASGKICMVANPLDSNTVLGRSTLIMPPVHAPYTGIFHMSLGDDRTIGLSFVSTMAEYHDDV